MARILLADDDTAMRSALEASLAADGHQVVSADNGADALMILTASPQKFQALISDVQMPELDGFALAEKAFALSPNLRVVLMSGRMFEGEIMWTLAPYCGFKFDRELLEDDSLLIAK